MRHQIAAIFFLKEGRGEEALEQIRLSKQSYFIETKHEDASGVVKSGERWFARLEAEAEALLENGNQLRSES